MKRATDACVLASNNASPAQRGPRRDAQPTHATPLAAVLFPAPPRVFFFADSWLFLNDYDEHLRSVERYDPALDAWEAVSPLTLARVGAGVAALDGKLYAVGGRVEEEQAEVDRPANTVERYDPASNAWEEVAPMATARAIPFALLIDVV